MKSKWANGIRESHRRLIVAVTAVAIIIALGLITRMALGFVRDSHDADVEKNLAGISYTEDKAKSELKQLQKLEDTELLSTSTRGELYCAMTELSYMLGDDMVYNHYMACAIFYLTEADDSNSVFYLTNKYIGRLYANGSYSSAAQVLSDLGKTYKIEDSTPQMQSSYYLSYADVKQMLGEDADKYLDKAYIAIKQMSDKKNKGLNKAKYDLLKARACIIKGDFNGAESFVAPYSDDDDFGLGHQQVYVVCDFRIPYYEITAKLYLHEGDTEAAYERTQQYIESCDHYKFRIMKFNLIEYMSNNYPDGWNYENNPYEALEHITIDENMREMSDKYGQMLLDDIVNTTEELSTLEKSSKKTYSMITMGIILLCAVILTLSIISIFLDFIEKDGLTRLNSRKKYEKAIADCEKKKTPYCLLILDIDDFKQVNDNFGHVTGDTVLSSISTIILQFCGRGITAYRYGGEELCIIFANVPETRVREIGEEIRKAVEVKVGTEKMPVTVSGGIGISGHGENVFLEADKRLYEAKGKGKNQII